MEPLLQVLAAADSTVREGLNAQVQALAEERTALEAEWAQLAADRARVDKGRGAVDDMVKVGRKMRQAQLVEIQAGLARPRLRQPGVGDGRV
jgi:prefoldin subunit 5